MHLQQEIKEQTVPERFECFARDRKEGRNRGETETDRHRVKQTERDRERGRDIPVEVTKQLSGVLYLTMNK